LKEVVLIFANKLYIKNPLNIGVGLGYIEMKNAEIINLRNISKGLYYNLNPEYIRKNLLLC
jgi:vacuolar-type H+-ATPase subunit C/Vma6